MAKKQNNVKDEHIAKASSLNLAISTKDCIEISNFLRYKPLSFAKAYLEEVIELKKAIPLKRFIRDIGHKKGMSSGRYPVKASKQFLVLLNSVEANAQFKGLNTSGLKITKLLSNKASIPSTGGRSRTGTKRTSLEIEVKEVFAKKDIKKDKKDNKEVKAEKKTEEIKIENNKAADVKVKEEAPVVEKVIEVKNKIKAEINEDNNQIELEEPKEEITEEKEAVREKEE